MSLEFPRDVLPRIFGSFPPKTLAKCCIVCKAWYDVIECHFGKMINLERAWRSQTILMKSTPFYKVQEPKMYNVFCSGDTIGMVEQRGIYLRSIESDVARSFGNNGWKVCAPMVNGWIMYTRNDRVVHILDISEFKDVSSFQVGFVVNAIVDVGENIAIGGCSGELDLWSKESLTFVTSLRILMPRSNQAGITCMVFVAEMGLLGCGLNNGNIYIWNLASNCLTRVIRGHNEAIRNLNASIYSIISSSEDCTIRVWSHTTGECLRVLDAYGVGRRNMVLCGNRFAYSTSNFMTGKGQICIRDAETLILVNSFSFRGSMAALFMMEDKLIAVGANGRILMWDFNCYKKRKLFLS